jgi:hypothetical protein
MTSSLEQINMAVARHVISLTSMDAIKAGTGQHRLLLMLNCTNCSGLGA